MATQYEIPLFSLDTLTEFVPRLNRYMQGGDNKFGDSLWRLDSGPSFPAMCHSLQSREYSGQEMSLRFDLISIKKNEHGNPKKASVFHGVVRGIYPVGALFNSYTTGGYAIRLVGIVTEGCDASPEMREFVGWYSSKNRLGFCMFTQRIDFGTEYLDHLKFPDLHRIRRDHLPNADIHIRNFWKYKVCMRQHRLMKECWEKMGVPFFSKGDGGRGESADITLLENYPETKELLEVLMRTIEEHPLVEASIISYEHDGLDCLLFSCEDGKTGCLAI